MTATIRPTEDGRSAVTCDQCKARAVTPWVEVARKWAREHQCPRPGRVAEDGGAA